jgi:hypothetical protein
MRIKKIENTCDEDVQLDLEGGGTLTLVPGTSFKNLRVRNLDEIKFKVKVSLDLGEINESDPRSAKLFD